MKVRAIYCECGLKREFIAEELAERWEVPANDEVWREYVFWRDYIEAKKSGRLPAFRRPEPNAGGKYRGIKCYVLNKPLAVTSARAVNSTAIVGHGPLGALGA